MRAVGITDLHHAALAVLAVAGPKRAQFSIDLLWRAHVADKYVKKLRKIHPLWGDGSLRAAALQAAKTPQNNLYHRDYSAAMAVVLRAIAQRRAARLPFCEPKRGLHGT